MKGTQHIDGSRLSWYEQSPAISGQYHASCFNFRARKPDSNMGWELPLKLPILSVLSMYARSILTDKWQLEFSYAVLSPKTIYCTYFRLLHQNSVYDSSKHTDRTIHSQPECYKKHATGRKDHLASKVKSDSDNHFRLICFGKAIQSRQWHHLTQKGIMN